MNNFTYKTVFEERYQVAWWKSAVYPVLAYEKFYDKLEKGQSIKWTWTSDPIIGSLNTSTGGYNLVGRTLNDEMLTIDTFPVVSDRYPFPEEALDHRPTLEKWADDQSHVYLWKMDADILGAAYQGAASTITGADLGSSGPITLSSTVVPQIFSTGTVKLMLQNVIQRGYNGTKKFKNDRTKDYGDRMPIAIIPPEVHGNLLLSVGYKNTDLGDEVLKSGYLGYMYGFNIMVSNSLPFTINYVVAAANATNGDTFTLNGVTFTLVTALGTTPGNILIGATATATATNIASALSAPFVTSSTYVAYTQGSADGTGILGPTKSNFLSFTSATSSAATVSVLTLGHGRVIYSQTVAANGFDSTTAIVHAILGTSQSVAVAETFAPKSEVSQQNFFSTDSGGYIAKDIITYGVYGKKVFRYQQRMLIDVQLNASTATTTLGQPNNAFN